ncbi:MAG: zinc ribbon domain-containing protein [Anaerolineales bacterium]|uniref:Zinc ribbon domain-containing protein n=1 Tax=Candidatus Desulfolinea nitratireducens TaxID=2841698 RepID=A0A8J6NHL3_9CHLR|nr:zinc ribbon domain-containing protein [Candidatus Desulfolinea nitratireducens]MBL6960272.1 zinc ribbon domain-containing protein [Anaerolineales bacterium]
MNLDPVFLNNIVLVLTGFGVAFLLALWVSLVMWTYRDIRNRSRDRLVQILSTLMVGLLNLPGVLVYLVLRPPYTLEEEYQRTLEEEALLAAIEDQLLCPGCERRVKDDWMVCPNCQTKLKKNCHECDQLMELPWNICPYCGTPELGMRREGMSMDDVLRNLNVQEEVDGGEDKNAEGIEDALEE